MKHFVISIFIGIFLGAIGRSSSLPGYYDKTEDRIIWPIPQFDGTVRRMTLQQAEDQDRLTKSEQQPGEFGSTNSDRVRFFLYTQSNPMEPVELDTRDVDSLLRSPFNPNHPTRIMIHGWTDVYDREMNILIREALLLNGKKSEINFISVDWSVYSATMNYIRAKKSCSTAGKVVAEFIDWMHDNGKLSFQTLNVYGHSLGAHVAGFTGKNVKLGKIHTIIGLDPAMPLFQYKNPETRLADTDAEYVETIHTNGGWLGFYQPIGQIAFYPNGGKLQPGCGKDIDGLCSHVRAVELFSEALRVPEGNRLVGVGCAEFNDLKEESCGDGAVEARLGDPENVKRPKGVYYLETNSQSPFAIGV